MDDIVKYAEKQANRVLLKLSLFSIILSPICIMITTTALYHIYIFNVYMFLQKAKD